MTPIELFNKWFDAEKKATKVEVPSACCLSTIGIDDFPNGRFVSLKGVLENNFIVTGPTNSRKGREISDINKVALTFWWVETQRQVRIQGNALAIENQLADQYFAERNRDSQIVSMVSEQGEKMQSLEKLIEKYINVESTYANQPLPRPQNWGGYAIEPIRMEFMEFKTTRFHDRKLYTLKDGKWTMKKIQP